METKLKISKSLAKEIIQHIVTVDKSTKEDIEFGRTLNNYLKELK